MLTNQGKGASGIGNGVTNFFGGGPASTEVDGVAAVQPSRTVILAVAASDAHVVANTLISLDLRRQGFDVVNLGPCTPIADVCDAVVAHPEAEAVLIGSLNGHAYEDLRDLPRAQDEGRIEVPVVLGGNLSVGARKRPSDIRRLYKLGITAILDDASQIVSTLNELRPQPALAA